MPQTTQPMLVLKSIQFFTLDAVAQLASSDGDKYQVPISKPQGRELIESIGEEIAVSFSVAPKAVCP